jgi:hypothetical protein
MSLCESYVVVKLDGSQKFWGVMFLVVSPKDKCATQDSLWSTNLFKPCLSDAN